MKLQLIYLKFPFWRAEISRLALHLGNIPFENIHPSREEFKKMKENGELPFGQMPVLKVDGITIAQTGAIARFCGKLSGHYPTDNPIQAALIDQIIDAATDITVLFSASMREKDTTKKISMREDIASESLPKWLNYLTNLLEQDSSGFFVGDSLTIADLAIWRLLGWLKGGFLDGIPTTVVDDYPALVRHFNSIDSVPEIRQWMNTQYAK
jgi:prostaglandin-H2 D-isomerase / glutathione transferase